MALALDVTTVVDYLRARGTPVPADAVVTDLSDGGVSSIVLAVTGAGGGVIVKRSRPALAVAETWTAPRERTLTEGRALALAGRISPGWSPPVLDLDVDTITLTMGHAPAGWRTWKALLLEGDPGPEVASRLGRHVAWWHAAVRTHPDAIAGVDGRAAFEDLRVDPYYRVAAARNPEVAGLVEAVRERMLATRTALVHGDLSPKNVLVGDGAWLIDFEVAHVGDPTFDLAFLLNHLALKAIHLPRVAPGLRLSADAFLAAYRSAGGDAGAATSRHLFEQLGCLMLARVDGKSPVEYLDLEGRETARRVAHSLLREPAVDVADVWGRLAPQAVAAR
jgi:tRNA A-37 threonylcarbamoyl transferase component Bud32